MGAARLRPVRARPRGPSVAGSPSRYLRWVGPAPASQLKVNSSPQIRESEERPEPPLANVERVRFGVHGRQEQAEHTIAVARIVIAPVPVGRRLPVVIGAIIGAAISGGAFLVRRPQTTGGFDTLGTWISIHRPLDPYALATAVVLGAVLGAIVVRLLLGVRRVWLART